MKRLVYTVISCALVSGCGSYRVLPTSEMQIQKIVEVEGSSKKQLFDKSRMWYASEFKPANSVIQYESEENGTIMGNGSLMANGVWNFKFSIATEVKDAKARITLTPISVNNNNHGEEQITQWYYRHLKEPINVIADDFDRFLKDKAPDVPGNW